MPQLQDTSHLWPDNKPDSYHLQDTFLSWVLYGRHNFPFPLRAASSGSLSVTIFHVPVRKVSGPAGHIANFGKPQSPPDGHSSFALIKLWLGESHANTRREAENDVTSAHAHSHTHTFSLFFSRLFFHMNIPKKNTKVSVSYMRKKMVYFFVFMLAQHVIWILRSRLTRIEGVKGRSQQVDR